MGTKTTQLLHAKWHKLILLKWRMINWYLWWIIMCWNAFYEINVPGFFFFLVESCVWQTMDGSSGSDFLHVWSVHRSCVVGQHGRQVCRQPIIAGSEMVTICSSGYFKRIRKKIKIFYNAAFVAFYWQTGWDVPDFSHVHEVCFLGIKYTLVMRFR